MSALCRITNECVIGRSYPILNALPSIICVRWRKPRHRPKAKSKEFIVRKPTPIDEEENAELKERFAHYSTLKKGIRRYIEEFLCEETSTMKKVKKQKSASTFGVERKKMIEINEKWNEKIKKLREARQVLEAEENERELERIRRIKGKRAEILKKQASERLIYDTVQAASFITPDNFEEKFAEALKKTPTDYNFAVDTEGKIIKGGQDGGPIVLEDFKFVQPKIVDIDNNKKS